MYVVRSGPLGVFSASNRAELEATLPHQSPHYCCRVHHNMRSLSLLVFICFALIAHVSYADDAATDAAKPAAESTPPADPQHEDFDEAQEHSGDANFNGDDSPSHSDLSEESTDNVKALSPEDFETHVGKDTPVLVEFYAP